MGETALSVLTVWLGERDEVIENRKFCMAHNLGGNNLLNLIQNTLKLIGCPHDLGRDKPTLEFKINGF